MCKVLLDEYGGEKLMNMLVDKRISQHKYVFEKLQNLGVDIPEGVDEFNVFSFYMGELWRRGENPLQKYYEKKSRELGLDLVNNGFEIDETEIKCFVSFYMKFYMKELWRRGETPFQKWAYALFKELDVKYEEVDVNDENVIATVHRILAFRRHWDKFQELINNDENYVSVGGIDVFIINRQRNGDLYGYYNNNIRNWGHPIENDWRVKKFVEAGITIDSMKMYEEAIWKKHELELEKEKAKKDKAKQRQQQIDEKYPDLQSKEDKEEDIASFLAKHKRK